MNTTSPQPDACARQSELDYVIGKYRASIDYYWKSSKANKWWYKWSRFGTVILSATLTLIAAISSASFL